MFFVSFFDFVSVFFPKNELTFWFDFGFWASFLTAGFSLPVASFLTEDDFDSIFEKAFATPFFGASLK